MVKTKRMMEKYTHPSAYLPDFFHGSCLTAAFKPGGLLLVIGMLIRSTSDWKVWVRVVPWSKRGD